jgi:hypothetical protein
VPARPAILMARAAYLQAGLHRLERTNLNAFSSIDI